jgi:hypothetical protein
MMLVTLGGCHLLYGWVDCGLRCEGHVKVMRGSGEHFVSNVVLALRET